MKKEIKIKGALNQGHYDSLEKFGKFIGADSIKYIDEEVKEIYLIKKNSKTLTMTAGTWGKEPYITFDII